MSLYAVLRMAEHLYERLFTRYPLAEPQDLRGKKIIVTGAAVGSIGYETAKALAAWGATVILTSRGSAEAIAARMRNELKNAGAHAALVPASLDLTDSASVNHFVRWYKNKHGDRLDVLVNNAGIHADLLSEWRAPRLSTDGYELHWRTNFLGPMQLTLGLLPLLQKTARTVGDARVVMVASHLHNKALNQDLFVQNRSYDSWLAYGISKLALVHAAFEIQRRFSSEYGLQGFVLHPGSISTNIANNGLAGSPLLQSIRNIFRKVEGWVLLNPNQGAQTSLACATSPVFKGGVYYERCRVGEVSEEAFDSNVSAKLWQQTEQWVASVSEDYRLQSA